MEISEICGYLERFGSQAHAYNHLQNDLSYFHLPPYGFISFYEISHRIGTRRVVFANPVCDSKHQEILIDGIVKHYSSESLIFIGIDHNIAQYLRTHGHILNEIGVESTIDLQNFSLSGKRRRYFRRLLALRSKIEVLEQDFQDVNLGRVQEISSDWLASKRLNKREMRLLTRPPVYAGEWGVRKFFCYVDGQLVGYIFFDPYFLRGECVGYCANILRVDPKEQNSRILDFCMLEALLKFKSEGRRFLALGISPLHGVEKIPHDRKRLRWMMDLSYRFEIMYNFRKLAWHKARYRGSEHKLYCAWPKRGFWRNFYLLLKAVNVF